MALSPIKITRIYLISGVLVFESIYRKTSLEVVLKTFRLCHKIIAVYPSRFFFQFFVKKWIFFMWHIFDCVINIKRTYKRNFQFWSFLVEILKIFWIISIQNLTLLKVFYYFQAEFKLVLTYFNSFWNSCLIFTKNSKPEINNHRANKIYKNKKSTYQTQAKKNFVIFQLLKMSFLCLQIWFMTEIWSSK